MIIMDVDKFTQIVEDINEYEGVEEVILLNNEGKVLFKSNDFPITNEESKSLLDAWKNKFSTLQVQEAGRIPCSCQGTYCQVFSRVRSAEQLMKGTLSADVPESIFCLLQAAPPGFSQL